MCMQPNLQPDPRNLSVHTPVTAKPQPRPGLLESIIIFDLLIPPLVLLSIALAGPDGGVGLGMLIGLILLPLWVLASIPVIILAIYGIVSARRMDSQSKTFRQVLCWLDLVVRVSLTLLIGGYWLMVFTRGYI